MRASAPQSVRPIDAHVGAARAARTSETAGAPSRRGRPRCAARAKSGCRLCPAGRRSRSRPRGRPTPSATARRHARPAAAGRSCMGVAGAVVGERDASAPPSCAAHAPRRRRRTRRCSRRGTARGRASARRRGATRRSGRGRSAGSSRWRSARLAAASGAGAVRVRPAVLRCAERARSGTSTSARLEPGRLGVHAVRPLAPRHVSLPRAAMSREALRRAATSQRTVAAVRQVARR